MRLGDYLAWGVVLVIVLVVIVLGFGKQKP